VSLRDHPNAKPGTARGSTPRLKVPSPAKTAAPPPERPPPEPEARVEKAKGPGWMPKAWEPAATTEGLRGQLDHLVAEVHPVFSLGVVPLALGAGPALVEVARPGCRQRVRRWTRAWVSSEAYLSALAADGATRHDRQGNAVEPVDPLHAEEARRRLDWLAAAAVARTARRSPAGRTVRFTR
jgi:hypothetical protein